jgi:TPP-dependent pyruvate/acetoin dehydrogenase alpha subunit
MTAKKTLEAGENPLVPNEKLRQMYTLMLKARRLEEKLVKRTGSRKKHRLSNIRGQEAVRVSTTIELGADDLISDTSMSAGMGLVLGGEAAALRRGFVRSSADGRKILADAGVSRLLDGGEESEQRLRLALGAASALKAFKRHGVLVVYANKAEVERKVWRKVLKTAQEMSLPILFVALNPGKAAAGRDSEVARICKVAKAAGVPGIPVDRCDAVALYRVTQESLGRMRGGDGPVLLECVSWKTEGKRRAAEDPIEHLAEFLLGRKICDRGWLKMTERAVRKEL